VAPAHGMLFLCFLLGTSTAGRRRARRATQEFFSEMKGEERMVCHFYRGNNMACKVRR
jgi:hypothetical protein